MQPRFCREAPPPFPEPFEPPAAGSVTEAVIDYASQFAEGRENGPIEITIRMALILAKNVDQGGHGLSALVGRLQDLLNHLASVATTGEDNLLAEIKTRRLARRAGLAELADTL